MSTAVKMIILTQPSRNAAVAQRNNEGYEKREKQKCIEKNPGYEELCVKDQYEKMLNCKQVENTQEYVCQKVPLTLNEELMPAYVLGGMLLAIVLIFVIIHKYT
jgi:hypothetical protein